MSDEYRLDQPVALTCPECGGAVRAEKEDDLLRFRCHIGHVLTAETMLAAHFSVLEAKLASALVALNERAELCRQMSEAAQARGQPGSEFDAARDEALQRAHVVRELLESEWKATNRGFIREAKGFITVPRPA